MNVLKQMRVGCVLLLFLIIFTGLVYPLVVTGLAQALFPAKANGSLIEHNGNIIGSALIGQSFEGPQYFWGRPSATVPYPYNAASSAGSNLGPSNPALLAIVKYRVSHLQKADPSNDRIIPAVLVSASASGLDPDISPRAAFYQVSRIARVRHIPENEIQVLIRTLIKKRTFGLLGEPRVNVLDLNIALDALGHSRETGP